MPELVEFARSEVEYWDADGKRRLDQSRYVYKPYPKMLYRADGQTRVVQNEEEHKKVGPEWGTTPTKKRIWDTRKPEVGFAIGEHHLAFLQHEGFSIKTLEEAKAFFDGLEDAAKDAFLTDAAAWVPVEPQKRGPGRPPKEAA